MKNKKIILCMMILVLAIIPIVSAETTFYEGDYFITGSIPVHGGSSLLCNAIWSCSGWSDCENNIQYRECTNLNECDLDKPDIIKSCTFISDKISKSKNYIFSSCIDIMALDNIINDWRNNLDFSIVKLDDSLFKFKNHIGC